MTVPKVKTDHMDSDYAKEMAMAGNKDYGACYECDMFYGSSMMTDNNVCYWCHYGDQWDTGEEN